MALNPLGRKARLAASYSNVCRGCSNLRQMTFMAIVTYYQLCHMNIISYRVFNINTTLLDRRNILDLEHKQIDIINTVTRNGHFEPFYSMNWHFWQLFGHFSLNSSGYHDHQLDFQQWSCFIERLCRAKIGQHQYHHRLVRRSSSPTNYYLTNQMQSAW